jgi:oligosaccharide repeat unit polymerase
VIDTLGSPWLAYAVLVVVTAAARLLCESWFAPAAFVGLVWSFFIGVSLLVVEYPIPGSGLWMLVLLVVAVQLGALIVHQLQPRTRASGHANSTSEFDSLIAPCRRYGLICTVVALAGCVYFLFTSLEEFGLSFTWMGVLEVGARWTLMRYDDVLEPWSVRLLVMWLHPAALLGGILFACSSKRVDRLIAAATLLPAIVYGVLTGARAAILIGMTCWIGGYVATLCAKSHRLHLFSAKRLASLFIVAACVVGMFGAIDGVRDSKWYQAFVVDLQEPKLASYMFGSPAAFSIWYSHAQAEAASAAWGGRTFAGEFDLLHIKARTIGTYSELSNAVVGGEETNVYTIFRGLIEDFTAFGAVLISACLGALASWKYLTTSRNLRSALFWLSAFYATFLFSPLVSLFSFNGALLAWVVTGLVIYKANSRFSKFAIPRAQTREVWAP